MAKTATTKPPEFLAPVETLAEIFGLTSARINQLAADGIIVRHERGKYDLLASVKKYCEYLRTKKKNQFDGGDTPDGKDYEKHRSRYTAAKADIAEIDAAMKKGQAHDATAVAKVWYDMIAAARGKFLSVPTKAAGEMDGMTTPERQAFLQTLVEDALRELSDYSPEVITGTWENDLKKKASGDEDEDENAPKPGEDDE